MKPKNDTRALLLFNYESLIAEENLIRFQPSGDGGEDSTDLFISSDSEEKRHREAVKFQRLLDRMIDFVGSAYGGWREKAASGRL